MVVLIVLMAWGIQKSQAQTNGLWTWESGSNGVNASAVYGTKGVPAASNVPGNRYAHCSGVGSTPYFWIFGGGNSAGNYMNDLWTYVPSSGVWTWISGQSTPNSAGVYGTQGVGAYGNMPGARYGQCGWTDKSGNIWIFGGYGYDGSGNVGYLNDLWKFNTSTFSWTWVSGSNTANNSYGVYGTQNVAATGNVPGNRYYCGGWADPSGNFWIFGGLGYASFSHGGYLNDLWEYNPSTQLWTWVSGSDTANQPGSYGTQNVASATNVPSGRYAQSVACDPSGNFWLFGGRGSSGLMADLWKYSPSAGQWTWVSGVTSTNVYGVASNPGDSSTTYYPGSRVTTLSADHSGNLWLFGGGGYAGSNGSGELNDFWKFTISSREWTWIDGIGAPNSGGSYGTMGIGALSNDPPARQVTASWIDATGNFWLMGGAASSGVLNDLWEYSPISVLALQTLTLEGTSKGNQKILTWQTQGETNVSTFFVERSTDGTTFQDIGNTAAVDSGNNSYSYIDANPPAQTSLVYRIKAQDKNENTSYSNVVRFSATTGGATFVFPNPASSSVTLQVGNASLVNTPVRLLDASGRLVREQIITSQQQHLDLQQLAGGIYFLQLTDGTTLEIIKNTGL